MRLIDADKLMLSLADWELQEAPIHTYEKPKEFTADDMQKMIWRTIRDCESAIEEQPTVKAIPIELDKKMGKVREILQSYKRHKILYRRRLRYRMGYVRRLGERKCRFMTKTVMWILERY